MVSSLEHRHFVPIWLPEIPSLNNLRHLSLQTSARIYLSIEKSRRQREYDKVLFIPSFENRSYVAAVQTILFPILLELISKVCNKLGKTSNGKRLLPSWGGELLMQFLSVLPWPAKSQDEVLWNGRGG